MSGFGQYAQNYNVRLYQRPAYRRAGGQDPIKSFVQTSGMNYLQNADAIRNMRFRLSNKYNPGISDGPEYQNSNLRRIFGPQVFAPSRDWSTSADANKNNKKK